MPWQIIDLFWCILFCYIFIITKFYHSQAFLIAVCQHRTGLSLCQLLDYRLLIYSDYEVSFDWFIILNELLYKVCINIIDFYTATIRLIVCNSFVLFIENLWQYKKNERLENKSIKRTNWNSNDSLKFREHRILKNCMFLYKRNERGATILQLESMLIDFTFSFLYNHWPWYVFENL